MNEDWPVLVSFFPPNWIELARASEATKGLRKDKDIENYLRTLLMHIGCGHSLRETVVRAKHAGLADISDVALMGRLQKAKDWLQSLCLALLEDRDLQLSAENDFQVRLFDATGIKEPGKTGSCWRIFYSVVLPSLNCDYFKIVPSKGKGTGESFFQYPIRKNDYIIADRGYSTSAGVHHVDSKGAFVLVRVNTKNLPFYNLEGHEFNLLENVTSIKDPGVMGCWQVKVIKNSRQPVAGRLCVLRKSEEAARISVVKLEQEAKHRMRKLRPETYEYAKYVILFTTFPEQSFSLEDIFQWYRRRWQIELVFKRFKSIAGLGHIPKHDSESAKAWLFGKLFVALLTEKLIAYAENISPWGYPLATATNAKCLA